MYYDEEELMDLEDQFDILVSENSRGDDEEEQEWKEEYCVCGNVCHKCLGISEREFY